MQNLSVTFSVKIWKLYLIMLCVTHFVVLYAYIMISQMSLTFSRNQVVYGVFCTEPCADISCQVCLVYSNKKRKKSSTGSVISYKPAWDLWVISEFTTRYSLEIKKREELGTRLFYNKGRLHYSDN